MELRTFPVRESLRRLPLGLVDLALIVGIISLIAVMVVVGGGAFAPFQPPDVMPAISLDPRFLPYYLVRSTLRMFIGLAVSLAFTFIVGGLAARYRFAERIIIPALDVLQSVPVLGFLSATVTFFIALFPGSLLGLEAAAIFAIFTGQVWNMTFSFYYSLRTLPNELNEVSLLYRMTPMKRFWGVAVPFSMIGLVWNTVMSFGGGWFFVSVSEAITVLNHQYTLPGIGSYVAEAISKQDVRALVLAVIAMAVMILLTDQLVWRPLIAWSDRFKMEASAGSDIPSSWFLNLLRRAQLPGLIGTAMKPVSQRWQTLQLQRSAARVAGPAPVPLAQRMSPALRRRLDAVFIFVLIALSLAAAAAVLQFIVSELSLGEILNVFGLGAITLLRVFALLVLCSLIYIPIGVKIGFSPKLARYAQPVVQFASSFPATFLYPFATIIFIALGVNIGLGAILLMAFGAQWYILFNVIAGARSIPTEMREMASVTQLRGWHVWRRVILPGIFPAWVTGALTAYGGAFNASIVAESVSWGNTTLTAAGIGAYIERATTAGDWPRIALGVGAMTIIVVIINRLVWRRLYALAETRYSL